MKNTQEGYNRVGKIMVICKDLSVSYANHFGIRNLNLTIEKGSTCAIVGKSGCGKTTLLHSIAGIVDVFEGDVKVDGEMVTDIRKDTAIILQNDGLFPWKSVEENIALGLKVQGYSTEKMAEIVNPMLRKLDIYEQRNKFPIHLSGGQRKRVAIARALALSPDLLLMDEPTGSLDQITKEAFQDQILDLYKECSMTVIIVTHDIEEAVYLGKRIIVMKEGQITADINNPLFTQSDVRNQLSFYELCLEVRRELSL